MRRAKSHEVFGSRDESPTCPLVAVVDARRKDELPRLRALVKPRPVGNEAVVSVGCRACHLERLEDVAAHVSEELLARRPFQHRADQVESVARIEKPRSRWRYERV